MMSPEAITDRKRLALDAARAGKLDEAEALLRGLLASDPRDLGVLLLLGDVIFNAGKRTEAGRVYGFALAAARQAAPSALQPFRQALARAEERLGGFATEYAQFIDTVVPPAERSERFSESVDILTGRTSIYLQQPLKYYFPGLPQQAFYPREAFPWAAELEAQTPAIRDELFRVMQLEGQFTPYLEGSGAGHLQMPTHSQAVWTGVRFTSGRTASGWIGIVTFAPLRRQRSQSFRWISSNDRRRPCCSRC